MEDRIMGLLTRNDTAFVVIDLQEKLVPAMSDRETLEDKSVRLIKGMKVLGIPTIVHSSTRRGWEKLYLR